MNRLSNPSLRELENQMNIRDGFFLNRKPRCLELNLIGSMEQRLLGNFMKLQVQTTPESTLFQYEDALVSFLVFVICFAGLMFIDN